MGNDSGGEQQGGTQQQGGSQQQGEGQQQGGGQQHGDGAGYQPRPDLPLWNTRGDNTPTEKR